MKKLLYLFLFLLALTFGYFSYKYSQLETNKCFLKSEIKLEKTYYRIPEEDCSLGSGYSYLVDLDYDGGSIVTAYIVDDYYLYKVKGESIENIELEGKSEVISESIDKGRVFVGDMDGDTVKEMYIFQWDKGGLFNIHKLTDPLKGFELIDK